MQLIENIIQAKTLLLTWQQKGKGARYVVGRIEKDPAGVYSFQYALKSPDFEKAESLGFNGYPAFKIQSLPHRENVITTLMKRLPPPKRSDYKKFLTSHLLPENFSGDNFALLCHTSAKLPSDGFTLIPDLSSVSPPYDYNMEIAGTRYYLSANNMKSIEIGSKVQFEHEPNNPKDKNAIAVFCNGMQIGNVNRVVASEIRRLLENKQLSGVVSKLIPDDERPLIYVLIKVS